MKQQATEQRVRELNTEATPAGDATSAADRRFPADQDASVSVAWAPGSVPAPQARPSDLPSGDPPRRGHRFDLGDRTWQWQANCMGVDPDLFFPERGASTREAKAVCRGCVVAAECLEYALVNGEKFGIWGGLSERERRRLRRERSLNRKPVD